MKNDIFQQSVKWILLTIVGGLFFMVLKKYLYKLYESMRDYKRSFSIVRELLRETRPTRSHLKGEHLADRLLDIRERGPLTSRDVFYSRGQVWEGLRHESHIDRKLQQKGLVEIFEIKDQSYVKLSEHTLTKMIIRRLLKLVEKGYL